MIHSSDIRIRAELIRFEDGRRGVQFRTEAGELMAVLVIADPDGWLLREIYCERDSVLAFLFEDSRPLIDLEGVKWRVI